MAVAGMLLALCAALPCGRGAALRLRLRMHLRGGLDDGPLQGHPHADETAGHDGELPEPGRGMGLGVLLGRRRGTGKGRPEALPLDV